MSKKGNWIEDWTDKHLINYEGRGFVLYKSSVKKLQRSAIRRIKKLENKSNADMNVDERYGYKIAIAEVISILKGEKV